MNTSISVEIVNRKAKKSGKDYKAIQLSIGDWNTLVFPRTSFEMNYIEGIINGK